MNEEATTSEAQAAPDSTTPGSAGTPPAGLPAWVPYFALAVVPALVVGILVYVFAGDGNGGGGNAPGIVEALLRITPNSNTQVNSYRGEFPADLPSEIPIYDAAEPVVSFQIVTPGGTNYFVVMTTEDPAADAYAFFRDKLDKDPWQVEVGQASSAVTGIQFTRPDNPDVSGVVTVHHSDLDDITSILLTYEDLAASLAPGTGGVVPQLGQSRSLPPGFPEDVPIYDAEGETITLDTYFQRGQGGQLFAVTLLTQDSQDDVIGFYTDEFEALGWNVTESTSTDATSFAVGIEFDDGEGTLQGEVTADSYEDDPSYTRVDIVVQLSGSQGN